jgi:hypothetical protein
MKTCLSQNGSKISAALYIFGTALSSAPAPQEEMAFPQPVEYNNV